PGVPGPHRRAADSPRCPRVAGRRGPRRVAQRARLPGGHASEGNVGPAGGTLEALLLFLDFPPRLPLLFAALLSAAASERTPFPGLDLPAEVHPEDEEDDHADDGPRDRVRLPPR